MYLKTVCTFALKLYQDLYETACETANGSLNQSIDSTRNPVANNSTSRDVNKQLFILLLLYLLDVNPEPSLFEF